MKNENRSCFFSQLKQQWSCENCS